MIILRIFIFIYGALTALAVVEEIRATQLNWSHAFYVLFSLFLIYSSMRPNSDWLLYVGLIGLLAIAIYMSLTTNTFQWSHIIVRIIITVIIIGLWQRF